MVFSSIVFVLYFLPIFFFVYFVFPQKNKNLIILLSSLLFYTWGTGCYSFVLVLSIAINFLFGLLIESFRSKFTLVFGVAFNLLLLGYLKYYNFLLENINSTFGVEISFDNILLPIGVSFFTFQGIAYLVDVYRKDCKASRSVVDFGCYISMFPQLVAGPIVRYSEIMKSLKCRNTTLDRVYLGLQRFVIGLAKKTIIADKMGAVADYVYSLPVESTNTSLAWVGAVAYTLQIYFDFSAYSDMAIGLSKMLGFDISENFNYPYIAKSMQDFWRRWHISLSTWFRDYLYIPLGGNRIGTVHTYFNLFVVFFLCGLWHGASWNFVFWGIYNGIFLIIERMGFCHFLKKIPSFFCRIYLLLVVICGWVFFRADSITDACFYLKNMFFYNDAPIPPDFIFFKFDHMYILCAIIAIILSTPIYPKLYFYVKNSLTLFGIHCALILSLVFLAIAIMAESTYSPFIYFRF